MALPTAMADLCDFLSIRPPPVDAEPAPVGPAFARLPAVLRAALPQLQPQYDFARQRFGDALPEPGNERARPLPLRIGMPTCARFRGRRHGSAPFLR